MGEYGFDGRVAVVTGAGRGIGRGYALLLAERGAKVVVNDLGGSAEGEGTDAGPASTVVDEITAAGGTAIADSSDVSTPEGGKAVVDAAIQAFGRIDAVVNNAGIMRWAGLPAADAENLQSHLAVHVGGSFNTTRAAWPHFLDQGYGRVVMTTSTGMLGLPDNLAYATAKAAVVGMTRSLTAAAAAAERDIKINCIAPAAWTRLAGHPDAGFDENNPAALFMAPELVAPMVGVLAHEKCPGSGEIYTAGAGRFARVFLASTNGYVHQGGAPTIEDVFGQWAAINDENGYFVPADLHSWAGAFMTHLQPAAEPAVS